MRLTAMARFLCLICVLCGSGIFAAALNREAFTITKYDLDVRLEPEQQRLGARGKITLRNDSQQPQKTVALQISSSLSWRAIRMGDKPLQFVAQPFTSDIDHTGGLSEAIVTLPAEIKPKDSIELEIGYEGVIPLDMTRLTRVGIPEAIARHTSWDQIGRSFTAVRGAGYVAWYPITTEAADFSEGNSLFEVTDRWRAREAGSEFEARLKMIGENGERPFLLICTPGDYSSRTSEEQIATGDCSWQQLGDVAPTFALGRYTGESKPPVSFFSLPSHEPGAKTYLDAFVPASVFVSEFFGKPTAPVAIADFADPHAAPFESGTLLLVSMADQDRKLAGTNLVHELVHSAIPSPRPWVYEGLAHFAEALYREQQGGRDAALDLLAAHRAAFVDSERDVADPRMKDMGQALATTFDETYYRSKAAYVWWMLRDMIGPDALEQVIHSYRASDDTDQKYVERLLETASKRDLSWFFDDWVYHDRGLPDIRVQSAHPWKDANAKPEKQQILTVTLENLGLTGAEVPFTVHCADSDVTQRIEVRAKSTATTRVETSCAPLEIVVNDGSVPESDLTNNVFKIEAAAQK
jgi:hypothetical protein